MARNRRPSAFVRMLKTLHWHPAPARPIACAVPSTVAPTVNG
jgi:hypothetical protein